MHIFCRYGYLRFSWLLSGLFLANCGGGDNGDATTPPVSYSEYQAQSNTLAAFWDGIAITAPATLPISGTANYTGYLHLNVETGAGEMALTGALNIAADFTANSLSGSTYAFADENAGLYTGSLAITGGEIDRLAIATINSTYTANIGGMLVGSSESFVISGDLYGDFLGLGNAASAGLVTGTAISGFGSGYMFGSFLAQ